VADLVVVMKNRVHSIPLAVHLVQVGELLLLMAGEITDFLGLVHMLAIAIVQPMAILEGLLSEIMLAVAVEVLAPLAAMRLVVARVMVVTELLATSPVRP
jgi:hypothetical protein